MPVENVYVSVAAKLPENIRTTPFASTGSRPEPCVAIVELGAPASTFTL